MRIHGYDLPESLSDYKATTIAILVVSSLVQVWIIKTEMDQRQLSDRLAL